MGTREHGNKSGFEDFFSFSEITAEKKIQGKTTITDTPAVSKNSPAENCSVCGETEWWIDVHFGGPHCVVCKPPAASGLVRENYFYDHHGERWTVLIGKKSETWSKDNLRKN